MRDDDVNPNWKNLSEVTRDRKLIEDRERTYIESARRDDMSWYEIADALELPSEKAAQKRYQELSNRLMGIDDDADLPAGE